jgi:hypothetical protein
VPVNIIVCGPAEFTRAMAGACRDVNLSVAAVAVSAGDLLEQVEESGALGVIAPAEWTEILVGLAPARRNVAFFAAGWVTREQRDRLADNGVLLLPPDPGRAVRGMVMALERIAPAGYHPSGQNATVVVKGVESVAVVRPVMALFYSLKGGVGKTATAANAAATVGLWARGLRQPGPDFAVAVVDNNPDGNLEKYFGCGLFARAKGNKGVAAFGELTPEASRDAVLSCLDYHAQSNVYFAATVGGRQAPGALDTCLALLARHFHFVFADLGVAMDGAAAAAAYATDLVLVSDTDPLTVSLLYERREEMAGFFGGAGKFKLVVNHRDPGDGMSARKAARLLQVPLAAELPYCSAMAGSRQRCLPVVCHEPRGGYAGEVGRLCQRILGIRAIGPAMGKKRWGGFGVNRFRR